MVSSQFTRPSWPRPSVKSTEKPALQPGQKPAFLFASLFGPGSLEGCVLWLVKKPHVPGGELPCELTVQATLKSISATGLLVAVYETLSVLEMRWLGRPAPLHDCGSIFCNRNHPWPSGVPPVTQLLQVPMPSRSGLSKGPLTSRLYPRRRMAHLGGKKLSQLPLATNACGVVSLSALL